MIFTLTLDMVLRGFKTQTRRIKKPHEFLIHHGGMWRVESKTAKSHRILYNVGRTYAVQPGRTQKAVARIILRGIREEDVEDISQDDAHAEGFDSREEFFATWRAIHGAKADLQQRVWVLEFELLPIRSRSSSFNIPSPRPTSTEDRPVGDKLPVIPMKAIAAIYRGSGPKKKTTEDTESTES